MVWIPPAALREARELVRHRVGLVWLDPDPESPAPDAGSPEPPVHPCQTLADGPGPRELQIMTLTVPPITIRDDCVALLRVRDAQIRRLDTKLFRQWGTTPACSTSDDPRHRPGSWPSSWYWNSATSSTSRVPSTWPAMSGSRRGSAPGRIGSAPATSARKATAPAATQAARRPAPCARCRAMSSGRAKGSRASRWPDAWPRSSITSGKTRSTTGPSGGTMSCGVSSHLDLVFGPPY